MYGLKAGTLQAKKLQKNLTVSRTVKGMGFKQAAEKRRRRGEAK
jgi:hypothetical protein